MSKIMGGCYPLKGEMMLLFLAGEDLITIFES